MSEYKLDVMLSDVEPILQICFDDNDWDDVQTKREVLNYLVADLKKMNIDDGGETDKMLEQLNKAEPFNEIGYFNNVEYLLNKAGYFTYNSDNWFEVYDDSDATQIAISEVLAEEI